VDLKQRLDASPLQPVSSPQRPDQSPQHSEHDLRKQYADLVSQHAELVFELGVEKDMGAKRAVRIEWLDSENERLRVELETAVALKNERAASAEGLRAENERLRRDLAAREGSASGYVALRQERDTLFAEVERLREAAAHLDVAKAENGELKESIGRLEEKVEERMRENMRILEEVEGLRSSERAMVVLGQENSQLREIKGELEKEIGGMRAVAGAAVVIEKERDELKKQVEIQTALLTILVFRLSPTLRADGCFDPGGILTGGDE
jgi:chromosome segregation ATPase